MDNPYQPSQFSGQMDPSVHGGGVTPTVISHLSRTKPWVQLIGVLGIICAIFMILAAVMMIAGGGSFLFSSSQMRGAQVPAGLISLVGGLYLAIGVFYFWLAMKLFSYGSSIGALRVSGSVQHLEQALDHQRSFWKTVGILTLIGIVLFIIAFAGALVFSINLASKIQSEGNGRSTPSGSFEIRDGSSEKADQ